MSGPTLRGGGTLLRMQNAKEVQQSNGAMPTWLTHRETLGFSAILSMPGAPWRAQSSLIPHLPKYAVKTYEQPTADRRWKTKLSLCKRLARMCGTIQLFFAIFRLFGLFCPQFKTSLVLNFCYASKRFSRLEELAIRAPRRQSLSSLQLKYPGNVGVHGIQ